MSRISAVRAVQAALVAALVTLAAVTSAGLFPRGELGASGPCPPLQAARVTQESHVGRITIHAVTQPNLPETNIVVALDTSARETERLSPDIIYRFQTTLTSDSAPQGLHEGVRVAYTEGSLSISRVDEATPFLVLALSGARRTLDAGMTRYVGGFGLSRVGRGFGWTSSRAMSPDLVRWARSRTTFCQSGGPGANSCSIGGCSGEPTECSVTCNGAKYYACCDCASTGASCSCFTIF